MPPPLASHGLPHRVKACLCVCPFAGKVCFSPSFLPSTVLGPVATVAFWMLNRRGKGSRWLSGSGKRNWVAWNVLSMARQACDILGQGRKSYAAEVPRSWAVVYPGQDKASQASLHSLEAPASSNNLPPQGPGNTPSPRDRHYKAGAAVLTPNVLSATQEKQASLPGAHTQAPRSVP